MVVKLIALMGESEFKTAWFIVGSVSFIETLMELLLVLLLAEVKGGAPESTHD